MKTRFLTIVGILVLVFSFVPTTFAEEIEIKLGETVSYEDLSLKFYDIEDSRCPLDVACVWEGKVSAMIHTSNQTHKIGGGFEIGHPLTYMTPYTITLIDVKPHPISTEKPDYVAILDISKIENTDVNHVDFRDASGEIIDVGCSAGLRTSPNDSVGDGFLQFLKCNFSATLVLVLVPFGIVVFFIFYIVRKRRK